MMQKRKEKRQKTKEPLVFGTEAQKKRREDKTKGQGKREGEATRRGQMRVWGNREDKDVGQPRKRARGLNSTRSARSFYIVCVREGTGDDEMMKR